MSGFHHTYEDENDARARETATEMAQTLKELGDYQNCILIALGVMIRSGASKASLAQVENATAEYGKRFGASWTTRPITDCRRRHRTGTRLKLNIKLAVEIDDNATIADMRAEVLRDVEAWLSSGPIMKKLAEAEDALAPTKAQFAAFKAVENDQS